MRRKRGGNGALKSGDLPDGLLRTADEVSAEMSTAEVSAGRKHRKFRRSIPLLIMLVPVMLYYIIFHFVPMFGLVMAFQDYKLNDGIQGSLFVGLRNFKYIFSVPSMLRIIGNTLRIGLLSFVIGFPFPIILAILINEVKHIRFKKTVQTLVYLPHFLSWVAVGGIVMALFSQENGVINGIRNALGMEPIAFLYREGSWLAIFLGTGIWKEMGFSAIIYLAALSGVDQTMYEAADLDGCPKWKQTFYISLPAIVPTIIVTLILKAGSVVSVGFDQVYNLQNPAVNGIADVISTWVYRTGMKQMQFSISTAMGLFNSLLSLFLVTMTNSIAKKFDNSLW